jgi:hypothetical protein
LKKMWRLPCHEDVDGHVGWSVAAGRVTLPDGSWGIGKTKRDNLALYPQGTSNTQNL